MNAFAAGGRVLEAALPSRGVLRLSGADVIKFVQVRTHAAAPGGICSVSSTCPQRSKRTLLFFHACFVNRVAPAPASKGIGHMRCGVHALAVEFGGTPRDNFAERAHRHTFALSFREPLLCVCTQICRRAKRLCVQGLVTRDVTPLQEVRAAPQYAALLNSKGRVMHDLILHREQPEGGSSSAILLDCPASGLPKLKANLTKFKLHADVTVDDAAADMAVVARWTLGAPSISDINLPDPPGARLRCGNVCVLPLLAAWA